MSRTRAGVAAGVGLGAALLAPTSAHADDFKVTNLNDSGSGSLRDAIEDADATAGSDRVLFKSKLSGEITLASFLYINSAMEILGPGARQLTVSGDDDTAVFAAGIPGGGDVTISGLRITDGTQPFTGGAVYSSTPDITLSRVVISSSTAGIVGGGGVASVGGSGSLTIERSTITGSSAAGNGGGVRVAGNSVTIENSTISDNDAGIYGGGLYTDNAEVTVINSTISGNSAGQDGGGIYISNDGGSLDVRSSTVVDNTAAASNGGGIYAYEPTELRGALVADNTAGNQGDDVWGSPFESAFSLIEDPGNTGISSTGGNVLGRDPKLKPLKNNGGPTDTHAFKKSPAKNKGPSDAPNQDQRGAPRKGKPDIGAYEFSKCKGVIVNRVGTAGKDKLKGTKKKDGILGLGGNDKLSGKKGKDGLCGGQGKDKLKGGPGKDKLDGGPGKDKEIQ